jgi:hypothetical protein
MPADPFAAAEPAFEPYVSTPDAFSSNGNGHHDTTALVDADLDSPAPDTSSSGDELVPDDDPLDGFVSDTPLLAESTLLDGAALDDVINEMVGGTIAEPAPDAEVPEPSLPEPPLPDTFVADVAPQIPDDDVARISWIAQEAPVAHAEPARRFEQVGANWQVGGTTAAAAAADDGALAIRRADARWALADIDAPGDFTIDATVDFTAGTGFGVLFRASLDDAQRVSGYSFDIDSVAGGGGYLLRQWEDNRQHWRPLAHAPVADPSTLYGRRAVQVTLQGDHLNVVVDGETVLSVPGLSRASVALGRTPSRGTAVGVQASATTELTVDTFRIAR